MLNAEFTTNDHNKFKIIKIRRDIEEHDNYTTIMILIVYRIADREHENRKYCT